MVPNRENECRHPRDVRAATATAASTAAAAAATVERGGKKGS
jgi:hypothetical protein